MAKMIWNNDEMTPMDWEEERKEEKMDFNPEEHKDCSHSALPIPREKNNTAPMVHLRFFKSLRDSDELQFLAMTHAMSCDKIVALLELILNVLCSIGDTGVFRFHPDEVSELARHKEIYRKWRRPVKFPARRRKEIMKNKAAVQTILRIGLRRFCKETKSKPDEL